MWEVNASTAEDSGSAAGAWGANWAASGRSLCSSRQRTGRLGPCSAIPAIYWLWALGTLGWHPGSCARGPSSALAALAGWAGRCSDNTRGCLGVWPVPCSWMLHGVLNHMGVRGNNANMVPGESSRVSWAIRGVGISACSVPVRYFHRWERDREQLHKTGFSQIHSF